MDNSKQTTNQENKIDIEKQVIDLEDDTSYDEEKTKNKLYTCVYGCMIFTLLCIVSFFAFSSRNRYEIIAWFIFVVLLCCCGCYCYSKKK